MNLGVQTSRLRYSVNFLDGSEKLMSKDKSSRGNASQFFVAGELCRRGYVAVVTLGNTPNTDILCSNLDGTRFAHIQVKTFVPGNKTCSVGLKAEKNLGKNFFWVLAGIPEPNSSAEFEYFIIPSKEMAKNVSKLHDKWLHTPGSKGQPHKDSSVRAVNVPPNAYSYLWSIDPYREKWNLIADRLDIP
ncbi:MAG: aspartate ammonia-lyase [Planctomycetes bacterium]|nr:aspartate ammonia-lyase [Planctomycetota bacterium]